MSESNLTNNDIQFIASKLKFKTSTLVKALCMFYFIFSIVCIFLIVNLFNAYDNLNDKIKNIETLLQNKDEKNKETFRNLSNEIRFLQSRSDKQDTGKNLLEDMPIFENQTEDNTLKFALTGM
jgi:predicted PurR-regulated permease PerM